MQNKSPSDAALGPMTPNMQQVLPIAPLSPSHDTAHDAVTIRISNGWNSSHPHNTRFKKKFQANLLPVLHQEFSSFQT
jgi:hypothetical protein